MTEELIELSWDENSRIKFYESTRDKFWISFKSEYSELLKQALLAICFNVLMGNSFFSARRHRKMNINKNEMLRQN